MTELLKLATPEQLQELFTMTLKSSPLTKEQADFVYAIVDELNEREGIPRYSEEELRELYLDLMKEHEGIKDKLGEEENPAGVLRALLRHGSDRELQNLSDALGDKFGNLKTVMDGLGEEISNRKKKFLYRILRPAAITVSIAVVFFFANTVTALATGFNFFEMFAKWTQDAVYFVRNDTDVIGSSSAYLPLEKVLENLGIEVDLPEHLPSRFEFLFIEPDEPTEFAPVISWFGDDNDMFHIRVKRVRFDETVSASERNNETPSEPYNGKYLIISNVQRIKAIWYQGIYELTIQGNLTHEELTQILDSIK